MTKKKERAADVKLAQDRKVTIGDVAALAGVSVGTVSNVINGRANVTEQRRQKVNEAIKALSFTGSLLAKGMRAQRYPVVGLCVPNTTSSNFVSMADMLEEHAAGANFELMQMITRHDPAREYQRIERLIASRASGVLLLPTLEAEPVLELLRGASMPTVVINRFVAHERSFDQVLVDHRGAFSRATCQLIEWGHRRVLVATQFPNFSVVQENIAGIRQAIDGSGEDVQLSILKCGSSQENFRHMLATELQGDPRKTVLIASSSLLAAWSIETFRELGLRCPEEISLLAAEEPDWAIAAWPSLSCIQQPTRELARISWDLLSRRMAGSPDEPVTIRCDARVNFRQSVARSD
ncbi:LacI family transcriptional regulator [Brucella tritici]|uniref:LacI family transcriptional regulator n=1 Tax=Brucella tritici TaxID=94626 RepID=A0A7V8B0I0_9HYPH|nr:LacI family DNA-binding transcriptional regulator [Brucella tritici]KAB2654842.1 LacI family transcriptional regulator [Brucella tritici]